MHWIDLSGDTYADHTAAAIHESMAGLVTLGFLPTEALTEFERVGLVQTKPFAAGQVRALRERESATQAVFAHYLGVSVNTVGQWERGERRATGAAAKLLALVEQHGLAHIR